MCDECDENRTGVEAEKLILVDVLLIVARWIGNILGTSGQAVHGFGNLLGSHSEWRRQRDTFAESAGRDIERITDR